MTDRPVIDPEEMPCPDGEGQPHSMVNLCCVFCGRHWYEIWRDVAQ